MGLYQEQGEEYEEEAVETETQETPSEEPPKKEKNSIKLNPKIVACICVAGVLIVGTGGLLITMQKNKQARAIAEQEQAEYEDALKTADALVDSVIESQTQTSPEPVSVFSDAEIQALRKWGYTADEIELAGSEGLSAMSMVETARAAREEAQKEALAAVSDTASPEYQQLLSQTWLQGEDINLEGVNPTDVVSTSTRTVNLDYEKVQPKGTQLYLKLYLENGEVAFMDVSPQRYVALNDSGNIVITIDSVMVNDREIIVGLQEVAVG